MAELTPYREKTLRREHKEARIRLRRAEDKLHAIAEYVDQLESFIEAVRDSEYIPEGLRMVAAELVPADEIAIVEAMTENSDSDLEDEEVSE